MDFISTKEGPKYANRRLPIKEYYFLSLADFADDAVDIHEKTLRSLFDLREQYNRHECLNKKEFVHSWQ